MSINPETEFPGKITPSSPDYPYGEARNITVPGDGTGTPWIASLVNDIFGFQQALLSSAGKVPSGTPDKVGASQYLESILSLTDLLVLNVADLVAGNTINGGIIDLTNLIGSKISWLGYSTPLDGGGNWGTIKTGAHTADGGSIFSIDASTYVEADHSEAVLMRRFGANGTGDLVKLQAALDFAAGMPVHVDGCANLSGVISGVATINLVGFASKQITLAAVLTFDNTNTNIFWQDVNFDATSVPLGTPTAVLVENSGHFEPINSGVKNAPRGNLLARNMLTLTGWGGDFSDAGQENFNSGGVNIGTGLHLFGIKTRGRWYNPLAIDCWQIGVFINGDGVDICRDTVVYNPEVANAQDNGVRVQPEDAAYLGCQDCGFVNPIVDNSLIDNIRINGTRCFSDGGRSTNAGAWGAKTDGGTDIRMAGLYARGNVSGVGGRIVENLNGLIVRDIDTDNPSASPAIYCVQIDATKNVHNVSFHNNEIEGGSQSDIAIILVDRTKGLNLTMKDNVYKGVSTSNHREVWGVVDLGKSINNAAPQNGGVRAFVNLSNCSNVTVLNFDGVDDAGAVLWGIEANNGTVTSRVGKSAFLDRTSTLVGGVDSAQVTDIGGNI